MSDEARAWAGRLNGLTIAEHSVINALAGYADADGCAWPKVSTIAQRTSMCDRHVRRQLTKLENKGLLLRQERFREAAGGQTSNYYKLAIPGDQLIGGGADTLVRARPDTEVRALSAPAGQSSQPLRTSIEKQASDEALARGRDEDPPMEEADFDAPRVPAQVPIELSGALIDGQAQDVVAIGRLFEREGLRDLVPSYILTATFDRQSRVLTTHSDHGCREIQRDSTARRILAAQGIELHGRTLRPPGGRV